MTTTTIIDPKLSLKLINLCENVSEEMETLETHDSSYIKKLEKFIKKNKDQIDINMQDENFEHDEFGKTALHCACFVIFK